MQTSMKSEHTLRVEHNELNQLRNELAKGAFQAEHGDFSKHSVDTLLEELNRQGISHHKMESDA